MSMLRNPLRLLRLRSARYAAGEPEPRPMLSARMLAALVLTVLIGLPVDRAGGIAGQAAVSVWTWILFLVLLAHINQQLRRPLMLCLIISTFGEYCLSLVWGLYVYWLHNIPFFVPPGHVLLFALGLTFAPRLPRWCVVVVVCFAAGYGGAALVTSRDTLSAVLAVVFLIFMALGRNRRLYATMFIVSLLMELYGTWLGNWAWVDQVPGWKLTSANPPLCVGGLYCALDLCVVNVERLLRRLRRGADLAQQSA